MHGGQSGRIVLISALFGIVGITVLIGLHSPRTTPLRMPRAQEETPPGTLLPGTESGAEFGTPAATSMRTTVHSVVIGAETMHPTVGDGGEGVEGPTVTTGSLTAEQSGRSTGAAREMSLTTLLSVGSTAHNDDSVGSGLEITSLSTSQSASSFADTISATVDVTATTSTASAAAATAGAVATSAAGATSISTLSVSDTASQTLSSAAASSNTIAFTTISASTSVIRATSVSSVASITVSLSSSAIIGTTSSPQSAPPTAQPGPLVIAPATVINGSISTPPIVIFDGGVLTVRNSSFNFFDADESQTNGTVYISDGSSAQVVVDGVQQDETRRVSLVNAKKIVGIFSSIGVTGEGHKGTICYEYYAASTDNRDGTLSVLIVAKEKKCSNQVVNKRWIIGGVVTGVFCGILIAFGMLWMFRDIAQNWVRSTTLNDEDLLITHSTLRGEQSK